MLVALREVLGVDRYFSIQCFTFNAVGFDITSSTKMWQRWWKTLSTCIFLLGTMICMGHYIVVHANEVDKIAEALSPFLQMLLSILKVSIFYYNHNDIGVLIRRMWLMTMRANNEELKIIAEENNREIFLCSLYSLAVLITTVAAIGKNALMYFYIYIFNYESLQNTDPQELIPFKANYPFDPLNFFNYTFIVMSTTYGIIFLTCGSVAVDSLYCWYIFNTAAQFRLLSRKIETVSLEEDPVSFVRSSRKFIYMHQRVIEFWQELNRVFSCIIFVEIVINCLQVCFIAYQLGRGVTLDNVPFLVLFLVAVALQLMIYCYGGQRLQTESLNVADRIYIALPWHNMTISTKKLFLLPMLRAQHCCNIEGFFFVVDLRLFLLVFKTAGSYVSLLWSLE